MTFEIRHYRPADSADLHDVCIRTGDAGQDARSLYPDPELLGTIFAEPYPVLEPELTFVVDNGSRVVGYIVGAADTVAFARRFGEEWLPRVAARFPEPDGQPQTLEAGMRWRLHHPESMITPGLADYPAHLHIDLLLECQRTGLGRKLMVSLLDALDNAGVAKIHLSMLTRNVNARAFYDRMGFTELHVPDQAADLTLLGRDTKIESDVEAESRM